MRGLISRGIRGLSRRSANSAAPILWAAFLTLLVAGPWLSAGFIFGTDWPGPRRFALPTNLASSAPLQALLAAVSHFLSGELTGKLFILGLIFIAAITAFHAAPTNGFVPGAVASVVYVVNPFVFGRMHYGQLYLLAGYAILPWVAARIWRLLTEPGAVAGLLLALSLALVSVAATHLFLVALALAVALIATEVFSGGKPLRSLARIARSLLVAGVATVALTSYWLVPLILGKGSDAKSIAAVTTSDLMTYAAVPDPHFGLVPNLLGLYGFWAENTGRFASMKEFVPVWPVILAGLLAVAAIGAISALRQRPNYQVTWVAGLLVAGGIALVLEMGVSSFLTRGLVTWLDATFPLYRGMRDAGKWGALLALIYSQLAALGTASIRDWIRALTRDSPAGQWFGSLAAGFLLALPLYYGNGLLFGMHGEIRPSQYPAGWYAADHFLAVDGQPGRTLFLPWREYLSLSFVQNQNSVVLSPAPTFFSTPVVISADPEVPGSNPPSDPDQEAISGLVAAGGQGHWAQVLAERGVKYVLLAREGDWKSYEYMGQQPGLSLVGDFGSIVLYRDNLVP